MLNEVKISSKGKFDALASLFGSPEVTPALVKKFVKHRCERNDLSGWLSHFLTNFKCLKNGTQDHDHKHYLKEGEKILFCLKDVLEALPKECICTATGKATCLFWAANFAQFIVKNSGG